MPDYSIHASRPIMRHLVCRNCGWDSGGINYIIPEEYKDETGSYHIHLTPCPKCGEKTLRQLAPGTSNPR